jgi:two-component system, OmpR family, response regulator RpaA
MGPAKILVIEDDYIVARTIERSLQDDEFDVTLASRGEKGLYLAHKEIPDLIILDIIMPDMDGYQVCREIRSDDELKYIPILFLTAKIKPEDKIKGFKEGADDYLTKPFDIDELILRIRAILKRTHIQWQTEIKTDTPQNKQPSPSTQLEIDGYLLDTRTFELTIPVIGKIRLTPLQYDILYHLMTHPGETYSPARLLDEVWDYPSGKGSPDLVRVHIKTLRERIETDPQTPTFVRTIPGKGYTVGH